MMPANRLPTLARLLLRCRGLGSRRAEVESDLLELYVERSARSGMPYARRRLYRDVMSLPSGGPSVESESRQAPLSMAGGRWIVDAADDLRQCVRLLFAKRPRTLGTAAVLALGIGVTGIVLTLVEVLCIRGLPIVDVNRVMFIGGRDTSGRPLGLSYPEFQELRKTSLGFSEIGAFSPAPMTLADEAQAPDRLSGAFISANCFKLTGDRPVVGRDFTSDDDVPNARPVAILGFSVWMTRYGGDRGLVGHAIRVNGITTTLVGVMPDGFKFPTNMEVWLPLGTMPGLSSLPRSARLLSVVGRLAADATQQSAVGALTSFGRELSRAYPASNRDISLTVTPINDRYHSNIKDPAWIAFATAGVLVLLVACANVATLLLLHASERLREIALRSALGATRGRIVRMLLVEDLVIAGVGTVAGLAFAWLGLRALWRLVPPDVLPYWMDFTMDRLVLTVLGAAGLGTSIVFGLVPAVQLARARGLSGVASQGHGIARAGRWNAAFVALQVAVSVLLVAQLTLGVRLVRDSNRRTEVIDSSRVLTMSLTLSNQEYQTPETRSAFYSSLLERLSGLSGVAAVGLATSLPSNGAPIAQLVVEGSTAPSLPNVWTVRIGGQYFHALGIDVDSAPLDERHSTSVVVNQIVADRYFGGSGAVGKRIRVRQPGSDSSVPWLTIVGIAPAIRQRDTPDADPVIYLPWNQSVPSTAALLIRGSAKPLEMAPEIREAVGGLDRDLAIYRILTLEQAVDQGRWNSRMSQILIASITAVTLGLCAAGLFAVTARSVAERMKEMGIRSALGASRSQLNWLIARRALRQVAIGLLLGVGITTVWEMSNGAAAGLNHPVSLGLAAAVMLAVCCVSCGIPILRLRRLNPLAVIRDE